MDSLLALHDRVTATGLLVAIAPFAAAAWVVGRFIRWRWVALGATLVTAATAAITSVGPSGTLVRTRRGLPHYFATSNGGDAVWHVAYVALDWLFWFALLACLSACFAAAAPAARKVCRRGKA